MGHSRDTFVVRFFRQGREVEDRHSMNAASELAETFNRLSLLAGFDAVVVQAEGSPTPPLVVTVPPLEKGDDDWPEWTNDEMRRMIATPPGVVKAEGAGNSIEWLLKFPGGMLVGKGLGMTQDDATSWARRFNRAPSRSAVSDVMTDFLSLLPRKTAKGNRY